MNLETSRCSPTLAATLRLPHSLPPLLKSCATFGLLTVGLLLHQQSIVHAHASNPYVASSLLHFYGKHGDTLSARRVFDEMSVRNVVPWSAIIACYSRAGDVDKAFGMCNRMRDEGIEPNIVTILNLISGISHLNHLECVHAWAVRLGFQMDLVVANCFVAAYAKVGRVQLARRMFDIMPVKDVVSWNSLMAGYSQSGGGSLKECIDLFGKMRLREMKPDHQTLGYLVSAITNSASGSVQAGKTIHAQVVVSGFEMDLHVGTALISMYLKFRSWNFASLLFDQNPNRDVVTWSAMISGLAQNGGADKALIVFAEMLRFGVLPTTSTIASALAACAELSLRKDGASIFGFIIRRGLVIDVPAWNSLMTMYAKCGGRLNQVQSLFNIMPERDLVSWNAIISGYAQNGHFAEAFTLFSKMRLSLQRPDTITLISLLQPCASWGALHHGMSVHSLAVRHGLERSISVGTSLVDLYSKGGDLELAERCFHLMPKKDLVSWCAIITGYASHGMGEAALRMFSDFLQTGIAPNSILFLSVLSACSHAGLVMQGLAVFKSMKEEFCMEPELEHCACIIDLLGKAGRVEEAASFVRSMSPQPNADVLGILLDACRVYGRASLADGITRKLIVLGPESAGSYVRLAHSLAAMKRWDGVGETLAQMKTLGLKKVPGWSSIELDGTFTIFFAGHSSHARYQEIIQLVKLLDSDMRKLRLELHG